MYMEGSQNMVLINRPIIPNNILFEMTTQQKQNIISRLFVSQ